MISSRDDPFKINPTLLDEPSLRPAGFAKRRRLAAAATATTLLVGEHVTRDYVSSADDCGADVGDATNAP